MIDIHAHILPGIDDGAEDTQEAIEMAKLAVSSGITAIVATPHVNLPGVYDNYYNKNYEESFQWLKKSFQRAEIPLQLYSGMEVFVTSDVPQLIKEGKLLTINGGRYMLVEFAFDEEPAYVKRMLKEIAELRVIPVVAHAERYEFLQDNPRIAMQWKELGYVVQANKGSFVGRFGRRTREVAYQLLDKNLISVIASDCHGSYQRTPFMLEVYETLMKDYSKKQLETLFKDNPMRICRNQSLIEKGSVVTKWGILKSTQREK